MIGLHSLYFMNNVVKIFKSNFLFFRIQFRFYAINLNNNILDKMIQDMYDKSNDI